MPALGLTVCEIAPASLQLLQRYWTPAPPLCDTVVAIVWLVPEPQLKTCAVVKLVPSTLNEQPARLGCTVTAMFAPKLAVSLIGPFIVTDGELDVPE